MNSTLHFTLILEDEIEILESREKSSIFPDPEAKKSIKEGRDNRKLIPLANLKASEYRKAKRSCSFCQNTKRDREENYFEMYYRNGSSL
jgi:hypothetical protein